MFPSRVSVHEKHLLVTRMTRMAEVLRLWFRDFFCPWTRSLRMTYIVLCSPNTSVVRADGLESCFLKGGRTLSIPDDCWAKPHLRGTHGHFCPNSLRAGDSTSLRTPARGLRLDGGQALKEKTPCTECGENGKGYFLPRKDPVSPEGKTRTPCLCQNS